MTSKTLKRTIAIGVFVISLATYVVTLPPTLVFWDVGEFMAAAYLLQVPHPPGAPLFLLVAKVFSMVPFAADIAVRMHFISALTSAFTVMFLFLISVRLIALWRGSPESRDDEIVVYGSSAIGALILAYSKTFWFNAVEAEVYGFSMFLVSSVIWLALRWYERGHGKQSDAYLILIAYLMGLAVGVHLLAILALFPVMLLVYFRTYEFSLKSFLRFGVVALVIFAVVYPGVVKILPSMLDGEIAGKRSELFTYIPIAAILGALYGVYYSVREKKRLLNIAMLSFLMIVIGYSTYTMVFIRANAKPPMNENDPSTMGKLVSYLNREQYGQAPLIDRRWNMSEPEQAEAMSRYRSDLDFFLSYQMNHMYFRYFGWNFIGAAGDYKEAGVKWTLWGIPLLLGLFGAYYHWRKDKKMAFLTTSTFLLLGVVLVMYFNMQEPQPRERDYFYVGSFFIFSLWAGFGVLGLIELLKEKAGEVASRPAAAYGVLAMALLLAPINMVRVNYEEADRSGNYLPWDYSYNLLQSCEQDAILFTNGDNDTFPLWYLQDVEGIRRDIRIVNLSLLNTPWYIDQLKNQMPHGAKKVPISRSDAQIKNIQLVAYEPQTLDLPVPKELLETYRITDTAVVKKGAISFLMPHTLDFGNVKGLRVQDIMVLDIIFTTKWQRPIYFAMTVADDGKIGLKDYLEMQGMAFKLIPKKSRTFWESMDAQRTYEHLFTDVQEISATPRPGFLWRGLQAEDVYLDEDARRLLMNYRQTFFALGYYYANVDGQPARFSEVLDRMDQVIPRSLHPIPAGLKYDIASFYSVSGDTAKRNELLNELVAQFLPRVEEEIRYDLERENPYILLMQTYEMLEDYDAAERVLETIRRVYANEPGLKEFVDDKKAQWNVRKALPKNIPLKP
ncbi:MAG: DUF2723 domain-containing protein [Ignavibacteria bacterium]|nr:DUF2723 domain-containing protein [Ignavibacteria bacterium]